MSKLTCQLCYNLGSILNIICLLECQPRYNMANLFLDYYSCFTRTIHEQSHIRAIVYQSKVMSLARCIV